MRVPECPKQTLRKINALHLSAVKQKHALLWHWTTVNQLKACSMNNSPQLFKKIPIYAPQMTENSPFKLFLSSNLSISFGDKETGEIKQMFLGFSFINEHFPSQKTAFVDLGKSHSALAYGNEINLVSWCGRG